MVPRSPIGIGIQNIKVFGCKSMKFFLYVAIPSRYKWNFGICHGVTGVRKKYMGDYDDKNNYFYTFPVVTLWHFYSFANADDPCIAIMSKKVMCQP